MITSTKYDSKTVGILLSEIRERQIALPRYQRDVVWPMEKKKKLIDSVRNNFPIGSLLFAEIDEIRDGVTYKVWRIIDGLQRTSTFQDYMSNPVEYITKNWVADEWISAAKAIVMRATNVDHDDDSLKHAIYEFMLIPTGQRDRLELFHKLATSSGTQYLNFVEIANEIEEPVRILIDSISAALDIESKQISVIKFVGSAEDQATAFEVLNTGSIQLNKYQIAASLWQKPCNIANEVMKESIRKYWRERLQSIQLDIDGIGEDGTPSTFMLFDVLVGMGRLLVEKNPALFKSDWADTVGFQIAAIVNQLRLSSINSIESKFPLSTDGLAIEVDSFVKAALRACELVNIALRPILDLKLAARTIRTQFQDHSVLHMCSLVASVMIEAIDEDGKWNREIPARTPEQNRSLANWYLIDRLRSQWGNAGDSTLFNRVWKENESNEGTGLLPNTMYQTSPDTRTAELALDNWFEEEMAKSHKEREIISSETKLILRYFYATRVNFFDNHAASFQIDHLVPIDFWKRFFQKVSGGGLPVNGIGNLCLMNTVDHDTKRVNLPKSWHDDVVSLFNPPNRIQRVLDQYFLIPAESFAYADSAQSYLGLPTPIEPDVEKVVRDAMIKQSRDRWAIIRDAILEEHFPQVL